MSDMSRSPLALACLGAVVLAGCASDDRGDPALRDAVVRAMADRVQAYKKRDAPGYCRKTFASTDLPVALARRLEVPEGQRPRGGDWEKSYRECARTFGYHGEWGQRIVDFKMDVKIDPPMKPVAGIDRTARVGFKARGEIRSFRGVFVRYRGDWKLVFEVN
jgi:hypothetical protein